MIVEDQRSPCKMQSSAKRIKGRNVLFLEWSNFRGNKENFDIDEDDYRVLHELAWRKDRTGAYGYNTRPTYSYHSFRNKMHHGELDEDERHCASLARSMVEVDNNKKRVRELRLYKYYFETLPSSIGNLDHLTVLKLDRIHALPPSIGNLKNLEELVLCRINSWSLPDEIGNLSSLTKFDLSNSLVFKLPRSIGKLQSLKELVLHSEYLDRLPRQISNLTGLETLELFNSNTEELLPYVAWLPNLKELSIYDTDLEHLTGIGCLQNLETLDLRIYWDLLTLPDEIGNLVSLQRLRVHVSNVSSLPPSIGRLQNLKELDIRVRTLPIEIGNLTSLQRLCLSSSEMSSLPPSIGQLQNLEELDLSETENLSALPNETGGNLASLTKLDLQFSGIESIEPWIDQLVNLRWLSLVGTRNLKEVPKTLLSLRNLMFLFFDYPSLKLFQGTLSAHLPELQRSDHDFLLYLAESFPFLGHLHLSYWAGRASKELELALACNRASYRVGSVTEKSWPLLYSDPTPLFANYKGCKGKFPFRIEKHDAAFLLWTKVLEFY